MRQEDTERDGDVVQVRVEPGPREHIRDAGEDVRSGDTVLASYGTMPLTSVSTADDRAGARAFELLLDRMVRGGGAPFRRETSPAELIVRQSTGAGKDQQGGDKERR